MSAPQKKPTREQELAAQIRIVQRKVTIQINELVEAAREIDRSIKFDTSLRAGENGKATKAKVDAHRAERDRRLREAEASYERAIRAAQGERQKRLNEVKNEFETARADLERQLRELNAPIEEECNQKQRDNAAELKKEVELVQEAAENVMKPFVAELELLKAKGKATAAVAEVQGQKFEKAVLLVNGKEVPGLTAKIEITEEPKEAPLPAAVEQQP